MSEESIVFNRKLVYSKKICKSISQKIRIGKENYSADRLAVDLVIKWLKSQNEIINKPSIRAVDRPKPR